MCHYLVMYYVNVWCVVFGLSFISIDEKEKKKEMLYKYDNDIWRKLNFSMCFTFMPLHDEAIFWIDRINGSESLV